VRNWTEEERKKQSEAIKRWKPWEKSTGPKTEEGKDSCSVNAIKHGRRCRIDDEYRQLLRMNREFVRLVNRIAAEGDAKLLRKTNRLL